MKNLLDKNFFFISTPLFYVNDSPHLGHLYSSLFADFLARYKRINNYEVFFITGCDQNGQKIFKSAQKKGEEKEIFVKKNTKKFIDLWKKMKISYTHFSETQIEEHHKFVKLSFQKLLKNKDLILKDYSGKYCISCEVFENNSNLNFCSSCQKSIEKISESNYFFKFNSDLKIEIQTNIQKWKSKEKDYTNQLVDFFFPEKNLDFSITRKNLLWGIPLDKEKKQSAYVWFDALLGYISVLSDEERNLIWNNKKTEVVQVIGKEIIKFHLIFWPLFLKKLQYRLPDSFLIHGWILQDNEKMSKSKKNVENPMNLLKSFDVETIRLYLLSLMSLKSDVDFDIQKMKNFYNSFIVEKLSNLHYRIFSMCAKYYDILHDIKPKEGKLNSCLKNEIKIYHEAWSNFEFFKIFKQIEKLIQHGNQIINQTAPWNLYKTKRHSELAIILRNLLKILKIIADMLFPIIPKFSKRIYLDLNLKDFENSFYQLKFSFDQLKNLQNIKPIYERRE